MENKWNLFEKFLITENVNLSVNDFLVSSVLIIIMSWLLSLTYQKVAKTLSNRKDFGANFMLLAFTTMLIITIVKSSLALSLGLVGALSIVRFRAAIKEPEELAYLFFAIAMGLGLGANQVYIVATAFGVLMVILWSRFFLNGRDESQNLFVTLNTEGNSDVKLKEVQSIMKSHFNKFQLKRYDENQDTLEISFVADIKKSEKLEAFRTEVRTKYPELNISFLDSKAY
ncbi:MULTISPECIES: DUF4956 domain-containing protein [unclassified Lentimicrobium]|uniref:DUF4956 domain-containing protein n=1 Tax=unclassified Lentimicrobium TaxID=2677434 RepID=UPI0015527BB4|nr:MULTISPECIES: DUF4956 domain-containing protein [unclassified Lentimicrobium]NPD44540.1 DUF4956 domain-containing protein [Lentimicrobium sp. S6]NPD85643.1 DUF4956 domain-containing protein [Lentimicrobium sp. L6]